MLKLLTRGIWFYYICIEDNSFLFSKSFFLHSHHLWLSILMFWVVRMFFIKYPYLPPKTLSERLSPLNPYQLPPSAKKTAQSAPQRPSTFTVLRTRLVRLFLWRIWFSYVILECVDVLLMIKCSVTPLIPILRHFWYQDDNLYI